jgi:hypothetical protein
MFLFISIFDNTFKAYRSWKNFQIVCLLNLLRFILIYIRFNLFKLFSILCIFIFQILYMKSLSWAKCANLPSLVCYWWANIHWRMICYNKIWGIRCIYNLFFFRNYKRFMRLILFMSFYYLKCWRDWTHKLILTRLSLHSYVSFIDLRISRRWHNSGKLLLYDTAASLVPLKLCIFIFWCILTFKWLFFMNFFRFICLLTL